MGRLNTGMNALGTFAVLKNLFGKKPQGPSSRYNNFISEIHNSGIAKTNYFDVVISLPIIMISDANEADGSVTPTMEKISLYAESSSLPGLNIQTDSVKRFGVGPTENVPYSTQFNDITINFIADGRGEIYKFFYNWMHGIVNADMDIGSNKISKRGLAPYEVEFKNRYQTKITITTYNEQNDKILVYDLYGAFPKTMPDINLSWKDSDGFMQFGVTFCYMYAKLLNANEPFTAGPNGVKGLSLLQKLIKIGTAVQTLKSLKRPRSIQDALASSTTVKNIASGSGLF